MSEAKMETFTEEQRTTAVKVYGSIDDMVSDGASEVEYDTIDGFKPGTKIRIGSVTAADMMDWTEANEGEAKRTAGLRLICKSLVNDQGVRYAVDPTHMHKLKVMRHKDTERILKAIVKLNGMTVRQDRDSKND